MTGFMSIVVPCDVREQQIALFKFGALLISTSSGVVRMFFAASLPSCCSAFPTARGFLQISGDF